MKKYISKISIGALALVVLFAFTIYPEKTDFSGTWQLNESKSDLGQFASFATRTIKADQKADAIAISRTAPSFDGGENTATETLTFDGKEAESTLFGSSKKVATIKWADDGKSFTINFKLHLDFNGQTNEVTGTEVWKLSDDGKMLTTENNSSSSFGDLATKAVYEKK